MVLDTLPCWSCGWGLFTLCNLSSLIWIAIKASNLKRALGHGVRSIRMTVIGLNKIVLKSSLITVQRSKPLPFFPVFDLPVVEIIFVDGL